MALRRKTILDNKSRSHAPIDIDCEMLKGWMPVMLIIFKLVDAHMLPDNFVTHFLSPCATSRSHHASQSRCIASRFRLLLDNPSHHIYRQAFGNGRHFEFSSLS